MQHDLQGILSLYVNVVVCKLSYWLSLCDLSLIVCIVLASCKHKHCANYLHWNTIFLALVWFYLRNCKSVTKFRINLYFVHKVIQTACLWSKACNREFAYLERNVRLCLIRCGMWTYCSVLLFLSWLFIWWD